jgi:hypothetical protein
MDAAEVQKFHEAARKFAESRPDFNEVLGRASKRYEAAGVDLPDRFIYLAGPDPEDTDQHAHVFVQRRGVDAPSLRYKTFLQEMEWGGKTSGVIGVEWRGLSKATAEDAVDPQKASDKSAERRAAKDLAEILRDGRKSVDEAKKSLSALGHDVEKINTTRLLSFAGASSQRFTNERTYSWFLPSRESK